MAVLVLPVGEDLLNRDVQLVGGALDRKVVHVVGDHGCHLPLLRDAFNFVARFSVSDIL